MRTLRKYFAELWLSSAAVHSRHSKPLDLVVFSLSRPLVTVPLAATLLKITPGAADLMLLQLGGTLPRELTGRIRHRAWGIV